MVLWKAAPRWSEPRKLKLYVLPLGKTRGFKGIPNHVLSREFTVMVHYNVCLSRTSRSSSPSGYQIIYMNLTYNYFVCGLDFYACISLPKLSRSKDHCTPTPTSSNTHWTGPPPCLYSELSSALCVNIVLMSASVSLARSNYGKALWNTTVGLRPFGAHFWYFHFHYSLIVRVIAREPPAIWCIITQKWCQEAGKSGIQCLGITFSPSAEDYLPSVQSGTLIPFHE